MNTFPPANAEAKELISTINFNDFDVSWAGPALDNRVFCFGSEDGRILITDYQGMSIDPVKKTNLSGEAINGVAYRKGVFAVSTRSEIMVFALPLEPGSDWTVTQIPRGAHDVIAGVSGHFFAPLGLGGLLSWLPTEGHEQELTLSGSSEGKVYFYRVISLRSLGGGELLASAARRGGIAAMEFKGVGKQHPMRTLTFSGLDVIDICPLFPSTPSNAAAALGKDGTLILMNDVLQDQAPVTVKYQSIKGVAYRLLSARGHLFVLTSKGLHVITGLIDNFMTGKKTGPVTPILVIPMEAIDANAVGEKWILIVLSDGVLRFDVDLLKSYKPSGLRDGERREIELGQTRGDVPVLLNDELPVYSDPSWKTGSVEQKSELLAGIAS